MEFEPVPVADTWRAMEELGRPDGVTLAKSFFFAAKTFIMNLGFGSEHHSPFRILE